MAVGVGVGVGVGDGSDVGVGVGLGVSTGVGDGVGVGARVGLVVMTGVGVAALGVLGGAVGLTVGVGSGSGSGSSVGVGVGSTTATPVGVGVGTPVCGGLRIGALGDGDVSASPPQPTAKTTARSSDNLLNAFMWFPILLPSPGACWLAAHTHARTYDG